MEPARDVIKSIGENARSKNIYLFRRYIEKSVETVDLLKKKP